MTLEQLKSVGNIVVGDILIHESGRYVRVLNVAETAITRDCYILAEPLDGKAWYTDSNGQDIMQEWFLPKEFFYVK